jgi:hypothetical protein
MHRLIWIATRGVMEILGLDPYQSETQYLQPIFQIGWSGNKMEKYFRLISTLLPLRFHLTVVVATKRKYVSALLPLYFRFVSTCQTTVIFNNDEY